MNAKRSYAQAEADASATLVIHDKLEEARAQIEQRFLDGGTALMSVLDVFTKLLKALENVGNALREDDAEEATAELGRTGKLIAALPAQQQARRDSFQRISEHGQSLAKEVLSMEDTLRYLRTFAMTAKITGAGIADFAGFAEEIVERIQFATKEVQGFAERISSLQDLIAHAQGGGETLAAHEEGIPALVLDLENNAKSIKAQRKSLADITRQVTELAMKVQGRLAGTLSSLQIGDVTRQRIEHCQTAFTIAETHLGRDNAVSVTAVERERVMLLVVALVREQLAAISVDFKAQCKTIITNIRAFSTDVAALMKLQEQMFPDSDDGGQKSAMRRVEESLQTASGVVASIEQSAAEAIRLSQSASGVIQNLVQSVETIQLVRTDIQYMALNTNLRCSKLGEEGRAINVVTNELRSFSGQLDVMAEQALVDLTALEKQANALCDSQTETDGDGSPDLVARIDVALTHVGQASKALDAHLGELSERSQDVALKVATASSGLDFDKEITGLLEECAALAATTENGMPSSDGLSGILDGLSAEIFKTYTMKSERDVHAAIFGLPSVQDKEPIEAPATENSDDDLFDEALF